MTRTLPISPVRDDGVGIDPTEIPRLTERFYRGDSSRNSATPAALGLGLAIVKHSLNRCTVAALMINSRLGHGRRVYLPHTQR